MTTSASRSESPDSERSLRERLIDVGVDLVTSDGTASLGLREIARRAGVSHGAPRRYFPTHQALLSAIARRGFEQLAARVTTAVTETTSPRGQLHAVARVYVAYALEFRGMFELMFRHDLLDSAGREGAEREDAGLEATAGAGAGRLRESTLPLFTSMVALVSRCRAEEGADASVPPAVTAAALWSNLHGIAQLWSWGSLQLAFESADPDGASAKTRLDGLDGLDRLVAAALDAHLGPVRS